MLEIWLEAIRRTSIPEVKHLVFTVGEKTPKISNLPDRLLLGYMARTEPWSIGHAHNLGAQLSDTEWIMKLDIDTLPSASFFSELVSLLAQAPARAWFNCGMFYFSQRQTAAHLTKDKMPLVPEFVETVCASPSKFTSQSYQLPAATNFICRRADYLALGGCDPRFDGYGWEDYQQIYMLERHQQGTDPLPGPVNIGNVTRRCRDEISRRKAKELFELNHTFCLFHRWHAPANKDRRKVDQNRAVLLDYIEASRKAELEKSAVVA